MLRIITFGTALIIAMPAAWADDKWDCLFQKKDLDLSIKACSAVISSGVIFKDPFPLSGPDLYYGLRASQYLLKMEYDRAIADATKCIELNPGGVVLVAATNLAASHMRRKAIRNRRA